MNSFTQTPEQTKEILEFLENDLENVRRVINAVEGLDAKFEIHAKAETVDQSVQHSPLEKNQIIKTLVFKASVEFVAVMCPGNKRVDEEKLEDIVGDIRMATPEEVREHTGYIVGGVSPFDLDISLYAAETIPNGEVRPAGGSRVIGVKIDRNTLFDLVDPEVIDVAE